MRRLRDDTQAVVEGDLAHRTHPHSTDEIGQLARTFESMRRWLAEAQEAELEAEHEAETARRELEQATKELRACWRTVLGLLERESLFV